MYQLKDPRQIKSLENVLASIPLEVIQTVNDIVDYGALSMGIKLKDSVVIALADHVNFAVERTRQGISIPNALRNEIQSFYPGEYAAGREALRIIEKRLGIHMAEDEAGFIALHFVNAAAEGQSMADTRQMTEMIQNILQVLKYQCHLELNTASLAYERFITHLKYFSRRLFSLSANEDSTVDAGLYQMIKTQYKEAYLHVLRVGSMIAAQYGKHLSNDEMVYLTIHVNRLMQISKD